MNFERYQRQIRLKGFGEKAQLSLLNAKVIVIGVGGLGCPALLYLAAAGIGTLAIADDDVVSLSNLHRQVLFSTDDVGKPKTSKAVEELHALNPEIRIVPYSERLTSKNALGILEEYDIVIDGTDNFATRYMINDACVLLGKTLVYGAVSGFEGQVGVFNCPDSGKRRSSNYRDLFPDPPDPDTIPGCEVAGVLGVLPAIIGGMQANEAIKLITRIGNPLVNKILTLNILTNQSYEIDLLPRSGTDRLIPKDKHAFINTDYVWLCKGNDSIDPEYEIAPEEIQRRMHEPGLTLVDIREPYESPSLDKVRHLRVPVSELKDRLPGIKGNNIVLICQTGERSLQAVKIFRDFLDDGKNLYSLQGGVMKFLDQQNLQADG